MIFGIGTDIAQVNRFEKWVENPQMFMRFFNPAEIMEKGSLAAKCQHYAARFAAKEAAAKALGCGIGEVSWQEIEILNDEFGAPVLHLHGKAAERAEALGLSVWSVSITHLKEYAAATVAAMGKTEIRGKQ